jgi:hypothetical protein
VVDRLFRSAGEAVERQCGCMVAEDGSDGCSALDRTVRRGGQPEDPRDERGRRDVGN